MVSPINYSTDVLSPIEGYLQGLRFGEGLLTERQGRESTAQQMQEREQIMGIRGQEAQRAEQTFQMQRAAAERQQAQAEAMQSQLMNLREMALQGNLTTEALDQFALSNASTFDEFRTAFQNVSQPVRDANVQFGLQLSTSLLRGNTDAALGMLDTRIAAAENTGTPQAIEEAQRLRAIRGEAEIDPVGFATANLANLTAQGAIDSTTMKSVLDASGQQGEATGTFRALQERALAGGLEPGSDAYRNFMLSGGEIEQGPLVQNIIGEGQSEFEKVAGKDAATLFSNLTTTGLSASRNLAELDNLEAVLSEVDTGGGAAIKSYLGGYGIATEGLEPIQAAEAAINRLVPAQRPPGSGTMSDADLALFKRSIPSLINQPGGNQMIIDTIRAINQYDVAVSIISGQALDGDLTPGQARAAIRELPNPLAGFNAQTAAPSETVVIDGITIRRLD